MLRRLVHKQSCACPLVRVGGYIRETHKGYRHAITLNSIKCPPRGQTQNKDIKLSLWLACSLGCAGRIDEALSIESINKLLSPEYNLPFGLGRRRSFVIAHIGSYWRHYYNLVSRRLSASARVGHIHVVYTHITLCWQGLKRVVRARADAWVASF